MCHIPCPYSHAVLLPLNITKLGFFGLDRKKIKIQKIQKYEKIQKYIKSFVFGMDSEIVSIFHNKYSMVPRQSWFICW